jgi:hypothetical protein
MNFQTFLFAIMASGFILLLKEAVIYLRASCILEEAEIKPFLPPNLRQVPPTQVTLCLTSSFTWSLNKNSHHLQWLDFPFLSFFAHLHLNSFRKKTFRFPLFP